MIIESKKLWMRVLLILVFSGMMFQAFALPCGFSANAHIGSESRFYEQAYLLDKPLRNYDFVLNELQNTQGAKETRTIKARGDRVSPNGVFLIESKNSLLYVEKKDRAHSEWLTYDLFGKFKSRPKNLKIPFSVYDQGVFRQIYIPKSVEYFSLFGLNLKSSTEILFPNIEVDNKVRDWLDAFYYLIGNADGNFMDRISEHLYVGKGKDVLIIDHADAFGFGVENYIPEGRVVNGFNHYSSEKPNFNLRSKVFRAFVRELQSGLANEIKDWFLENQLVKDKLSDQQQEAFLARLTYLSNLNFERSSW